MGGVLMFSREYLAALSKKTGFRADSLQKQMALLDILRGINEHPKLGKQYALKGGTAINLFWFQLPRLSVDIDLNYVGSPHRDTMLQDRPLLEHYLIDLIHAKGISVENAPADEHAGAKWRLRAPSVFGGNFTQEIDLNYLMRVPLWGLEMKKPFPLDEEYTFDCAIVSIEELFGGKIKALMDRSAARDLYDVSKLSQGVVPYDVQKLRISMILFGLTCDEDWRKKDFRTIDAIDRRMLDDQMNLLRQTNELIDLEDLKNSSKRFIRDLMDYDEPQRRFIDRFLDEGIYEPELIIRDAEQASRLMMHPAVRWKLQNHRRHLHLDG